MPVALLPGLREAGDREGLGLASLRRVRVLTSPFRLFQDSASAPLTRKYLFSVLSLDHDGGVRGV